jgi:hypothetical protein
LHVFYWYLLAKVFGMSNTIKRQYDIWSRNLTSRLASKRLPVRYGWLSAKILSMSNLVRWRGDTWPWMTMRRPSGGHEKGGPSQQQLGILLSIGTMPWTRSNRYKTLRSIFTFVTLKWPLKVEPRSKVIADSESLRSSSHKWFIVA